MQYTWYFSRTTREKVAKDQLATTQGKGKAITMLVKKHSGEIAELRVRDRAGPWSAWIHILPAPNGPSSGTARRAKPRWTRKTLNSGTPGTTMPIVPGTP